MFALESGENTPKDKLKISRAQRDIDAVHWGIEVATSRLQPDINCTQKKMYFQV